MITARFTVDRLSKKLSAAVALAAGADLIAEYEAALQPIARDISGDIRASGRGGAHNSEFAKQETRVFKSGSGRYNILFGWLNPSASARERGNGGKLWYQYQDAGFHLFGGPMWIAGVGATIDRRHRVVEAIEDVNRRYVGDLAKILER